MTRIFDNLEQDWLNTNLNLASAVVVDFLFNDGVSPIGSEDRGCQ